MGLMAGASIEVFDANTILGQWMEVGDGWLRYHQNLRVGVKRPYWEFAAGKRNFFKEEELGSGLTLRAGPVEAYSTVEMAEIVEGTTRAYISWGLFGNFPVSDEVEYGRLVGEMAGGFEKKRLIVSVWDEQSGYMGGAMAIIGQGESRVRDLIGASQATLPTLAALRFEDGVALGVMNLPEKQAACFVRFTRLPDQQWREENKSFIGRFTRIVLGELVESVGRYNSEVSDLDEVRGVVLDTHDPKLVTMLVRYYAGRIVDLSADPTPMVLPPNPLGWHYKSLRPAVVGFNFDEMLVEVRRNGH